MTVLITGADGQLGKELCRILKNGKSAIGILPKEFLNCKVISLTIADLDITKPENVTKTLINEKPNIVINCAAYTNVDGAESDKETAFLVNAEGVKNLSSACKNINADFIHISTDYVFDGKAKTPYCESDATNPQNVYGESKALGEKYALEYEKSYVIRTAWLYGKQGKNFVKTITRISAERDTINVVNDQTGSPTNAEDLAHHVLKLAESRKYGVYHCTGAGSCTWYDFALEIVKLANTNCKVLPCFTKDFPTAAKRPEFSVLNNNALNLAVGNQMRPWKEALKDYFRTEQP